MSDVTERSERSPNLTLRWVKVDAYHARTECGRFSISKAIVLGSTRYEAWRLGQTSKQIGSVQLEADATSQERQEARAAMRALCEAAA